jgi:hypothetical protein
MELRFPLAQFRKAQLWRLIPTRFPPVDLFRDVAPSNDWLLLQEIEGRTNERLVEQALSRGLIRPEDRVEKSNSSYIMSPFTHPNPEGSRFSDGTYGVLYGGLDFETAVAEVKSQREVFLRHTSQKPQRLDMRAVVMDLDGSLHDIRGSHPSTLDDEEKSRAIARSLRDEGSWGLVFNSHAVSGRACVCVFHPPALSNCRQECHLVLVWDGQKISEILEYSRSNTIPLGAK